MTERELAWAAGLFEGEGTIRINKPTRRNWGSLLCSVVNTDIEVVQFFQERWPAFMRRASGLGPRQRDAWVWVAAARQASSFLREIEPHVVTQRVKAKLALALAFQAQKRSSGPFDDEYAEQQWIFYWQMAELNVRGRQPPPPPVQLGMLGEDVPL